MSEIISLGPDLERLLNWLPVPVFVYGREGTFHLVNPALVSMTGTPPARCIGRNVAGVLAEDVRRRVAQEDERVLAGETVHSEITFRIPGGDRDFTILVTKRQAHHPEWGGVIVGVAQDVTVRAQSDQAQTMSYLSHELQSPLSAITGLSELLLESNLAAEQRESLHLIQSTAESSRALLADMLDASQPGLGKWSWRPLEFQLREFLDDVLKPFKLPAGARHLHYSYSIAEDVPGRLQSDPLRLRQVLQNLVGNAIKYTETGSVEIGVTVAPDFTGGPGILFTVRDTGIGIPKEKQSLIFEPFVQAHSSPTRRYAGTGLGLSIASQIVALLGGRIWVESELSKGSVFSFVIPSRPTGIDPGRTGAVREGDGFNRASALAIAGGDSELLKELAELFLQESPRLLGDLRVAVQERDPKKLDASAHALKGAASNFGARAVVEAALRLESKGRAGDVDGIDEALASLEQVLEPLLAELRSL